MSHPSDDAAGDNLRALDLSGHVTDDQAVPEADHLNQDLNRLTNHLSHVTRVTRHWSNAP